MGGRLLSTGHSIIGTNRTKSKAQWLLDKGMKWADTPRGVAEAADIVFVTDPRGTYIELTEGLGKSSRTGLAKQPAE
jgi:3-hydroxyisobutyrate dehydrogenase-like beta-hydroxyacid dehydrogenase